MSICEIGPLYFLGCAQLVLASWWRITASCSHVSISVAKTPQLLIAIQLYLPVFSKGWLYHKLGLSDLMVCLDCQEENRLLLGQQHQAQFGLKLDFSYTIDL